MVWDCDWILLAKEGDRCRGLVNTVLNLRLRILTSWATDGFAAWSAKRATAVAGSVLHADRFTGRLHVSAGGLQMCQAVFREPGARVNVTVVPWDLPEHCLSCDVSRLHPRVTEQWCSASSRGCRWGGGKFVCSHSGTLTEVFCAFPQLSGRCRGMIRKRHGSPFTVMEVFTQSNPPAPHISTRRGHEAKRSQHFWVQVPDIHRTKVLLVKVRSFRNRWDHRATSTTAQSLNMWRPSAKTTVRVGCACTHVAFYSLPFTAMRFVYTGTV
jgi:hypothetical protein